MRVGSAFAGRRQQIHEVARRVPVVLVLERYIQVRSGTEELEQGPECEAVAPVSLQGKINLDPLDTCNLCPRRDRRHVARAKIPKQEIVKVHAAISSLDSAEWEWAQGGRLQRFFRPEWARVPSGSFGGEGRMKRTFARGCSSVTIAGTGPT